DGTTLAWEPSAIVDHHSVGSILCEGLSCGLGGLPNGMPVPQDETTDQPLSDWEFADDLSTFTMEQTEISMEQNASTGWTYSGTEVSRMLVPAADCLCE